jgi:hypothetical protein
MRTVIALHPSADAAHSDFSLVRQAVGPVPLVQIHPFQCSPLSQSIVDFCTDPLPPLAVAKAGDDLSNHLRANPSVQAALDAAFVNGPGPIYIDATAPRSQTLPWETLTNAAGQFAALSGWPVSRVVSSPVTPPDTERTLDPPLRVLAIIGAARVDVVPEARRLHDALSGRRAAVPFELRVLGGADSLQQEVAAWNDVDSSFSFLKDIDQLVEAIGSWRPHILHFFCHGFAGENPHLELTTRGDTFSDAERGSLRVEEMTLQRILTRHPALWLVTLNCCLGAAATDGSSSLAARMVLQGYPLVVGMREPIAADDAHVFSGSFLASTLRKLEHYLAAGDYRREVEWADVLSEPREDLCLKYGGKATAPNVKAWTLPVLHALPGRFELVGPRTAPALGPDEVATLVAKIQKLLDVRAQLAQIKELPPATLQALDGEIDQLRLQLAPPGQ